MNKILNTVFINADYQKRNCPDKSQQIAFEKTLQLGEITSIAIKAVPKLLAVSILLSLGSIAWAGGSGSLYLSILVIVAIVEFLAQKGQ
ncbi:MULTISPECIES: hypothetical protein [unclassified Acinetobacter]|uniref:hypothetical protein n=1 Tax=unclassified Acinetobacter TaxID=196816 RepID=UPI0015D35134|nr:MULTISPECIES: hypothetical protein [unclassified Acinetobacter]UUS65955.1 hypothetical protein MST18_04295 [Acinetobacter sp. YH12068_T]